MDSVEDSTRTKRYGFFDETTLYTVGCVILGLLRRQTLEKAFFLGVAIVKEVAKDDFFGFESVFNGPVIVFQDLDNGKLFRESGSLADLMTV